MEDNLLGEQLNIRNAKVIARVREQAALRGMTMTELIDMAVQALEPAPLQRPSAEEIARRRAALQAAFEADHARLKPGFTTNMDAFYDPETGAPI